MADRGRHFEFAGVKVFPDTLSTRPVRSVAGGDMRAFTITVFVCVGLLTALQRIRDDDKEALKKEKKLAQADAVFEKTEEAVEYKKVMAEMVGFLDKANQIELFRLDPNRLPDGKKDGKKEFHGFEILSAIRVETERQCNEATAFLGKTLHWNELRMALCFDPRHGMRVISGKRTLDFLICFACSRVQIFEGKDHLTTLPLGFIDKNNPIKRLLDEDDKKNKERK
jgi:hypothetical protein